MLHFIFSLLIPYANCVIEDLYRFNVDELFNSVIGPVYKVRRTAHTTPANPFDGHNFTRTTHPGVTAHDIYQNYTEEPQLKNKMALQSILNDEVSGKPNFEVDELKILSRRFDKALESDNNKPGKPILRELYFYLDDIPMIRNSKFLIYLIMQHFIYQTRYKLPYAQKMREEYIPRIRYKIGYAFSLLRILKTKQYVLYSALDRNKLIYDGLTVYIKIFEKIVRLDLEIKDLIIFIRNLERERVEQFAKARIRLNKIRDEDDDDADADAERRKGR